MSKELKIAFEMARELSNNFNGIKYEELWRFCTDNEIFICDTDEGVCIEDDLFRING